MELYNDVGGNVMWTESTNFWTRADEERLTVSNIIFMTLNSFKIN